MAILFAYAFMIRAESAFLALVCYYLYSMVSHLYKGWAELFTVTKRIIPFALIATLFSLLLNINFTPEDKLYQSFRPYQFTLWDFGQDPSTLKLNSAKDSVILAAAEDHFISDTVQINSAFFERIGLHKKDKTLSSASGYFENSAYMLKRAFDEIKTAKNYLLSSLVFALAFLLCLSISAERSKQEKAGLISVFLVCLVLITFLCLFMKLERHVIVPLTMGAVLYMLIFSSSQKELLSWQKCVLLVGLAVLIYDSYNQYGPQKASALVSKELSADVQKRFTAPLVYMDLYSMVKLHDRLFERDDYPYTRTLSFDNAVISYYPQCKEKMLRLGQPTAMNELADNFTSDPQKTIFIFNKGREHLFERYFSVVYGKALVFEKIASPFSTDNRYPFSYFQAVHKKHPSK